MAPHGRTRHRRESRIAGIGGRREAMGAPLNPRAGPVYTSVGTSMRTTKWLVIWGLLGFATGAREAAAVLVAPGDLLVVDADAFSDFRGGVIHVNPVTGAHTPVASGGNFVTPVAIAI